MITIEKFIDALEPGAVLSADQIQGLKERRGKNLVTMLEDLEKPLDKASLDTLFDLRDIGYMLHENGYPSVNCHNNFWTRLRDSYSMTAPVTEIIEEIKNESYSMSNSSLGIYFAGIINKTKRYFREEFPDLPEPTPEQTGAEYVKRVVEYISPGIDEVYADKKRLSEENGNPETWNSKARLSAIRSTLIDVSPVIQREMPLYEDLNRVSIEKGYSNVGEAYKQFEDVGREKVDGLTKLEFLRNDLKRQRKMAAIIGPIFEGITKLGYENLER